MTGKATRNYDQDFTDQNTSKINIHQRIHNNFENYEEDGGEDFSEFNFHHNNNQKPHRGRINQNFYNTSSIEYYYDFYGFLPGIKSYS